MRRLSSWLLGAALAALTACAANPVSLSKAYNFEKVRRVAVLGFSPIEGVSESGSTFTALFEKVLIQAGYQVVERHEIERVLKEQNFQLSGSVEPAQAVKLGTMLGTDALVLGSVTLFSKEEKGVVMVDIETTTKEPVLSQRRVESTKDGKKVVETLNVVVDYRVMKEVRQQPQVYRLQAESGAVARMIDAQTGEIAWVGSATEEGYNVQTASELAAQRIATGLKKALAQRAKGKAS